MRTTKDTKEIKTEPGYFVSEGFLGALGALGGSLFGSKP
jgi:hypothetical protein